MHYRKHLPILGFSALILALLTPAVAADKPVDKMIDEMIKGRRIMKPMPYLTHTYGDMSIDEAYEIQKVLDVRLSGRLGPASGYKVAYASEAAQKQFGVDEPARGTFFLSQRVPNATVLHSKDFMEILLETEVAFTIDAVIKEPLKNVEELKKVTRWIHAAFDAGDYRFVTSGPKGVVQDMIASGTGAHYYVLGPGKDPATIEADDLTLKVIKDGEVIRTSSSAEVMGDPWNSALWCVNDVIKRGGRIRAGTVILTGTAAPAFRASGNDIKGDFTGDCGPLGKVRLRIE